MRSYLPVFLVCVLFPFFAHAEVRINEVAWMGGNGNANCEWIELYNSDDGAVDISGWSLTVNTTANALLEALYPGDLVIEPYGYYVIARKFSNTATSASTCHPYFENIPAVHLGGIGALNNTALSISLFDTAHTLIDTVSDDTVSWSDYSKANTGNYDTVQRNNTNWTLNAPTPASPNTATSPLPVSSTSTATPSPDATTVKVWDKDQIRSLAIVSPDILYAGVPFTFSSITSPKDARKFKSHTWNFGDFTTSRLSSPTHTYTAPGTYLVHLTVDGDTPIELSKTVTVITPSLSIRRLTNGDLEITNTGTTKLDISAFTIVGTDTFVIPSHSIILANAKITLPTSIVQDAHGIFTPNNTLIASVVDASLTPQMTFAAKKTIPPPASYVNPSISLSPASTTPPVFELSTTTPTVSASSVSIAATTTRSFPAYVTLIILLTIAIGASLIKTRLQ